MHTLKQKTPITGEQFTALLINATSAAQVLQGDAAELCATDVYRRVLAPIAAVRPRSVEQLQAVVRLCSEHNIALAVRGGGASYTDGYNIHHERAITLDMGLLSQIVEINQADGYVTVEAGTSWASLKAALDERGLRTPFWGPFSGLHATVGGSVSQHTISHGSGAYGPSPESVLAVDVVLADGSLLRTGSAVLGGKPFLRHFGPDLTGLFTGDCGAFGVKARITLPLLRQKPEHQVISFAFSNFTAMHESMRAIAQERIEDTHFALDGALSQGQIARQEGAGQMLQIALSILQTSPSYWSGFKQLIKSAVSAKKAISTSPFMTHYIVEGFSQGEARAKLHRLREINLHYGREIPATVPSVVRGMPFAPFFNTLGPSGERWVPLHGILPHSAVADFHQQLNALYEARKAEMKRLGIWCGGMFGALSSSGFLYEIALYWPDEITAYHRAVIPADYLAQLPVYGPNPEARAYVDALKKAIVDLFCQHGAVNFQLGKAYPFAERLSPEALKLTRAIKQHIDPGGIVSAGNLGL